MTDRKLLEAAAKAEGHGVEFDELSGLTFFDSRFTGLLWNPLANDGDALRLAVTLDIRFSPKANGGENCCAGLTFEPGGVFVEDRGTDPFAATRRAIVRAAAAMAPE